MYGVGNYRVNIGRNEYVCKYLMYGDGNHRVNVGRNDNMRYIKCLVMVPIGLNR